VVSLPRFEPAPRGEPKGTGGEAWPPTWILLHGATRLAAATLEGWTEIDAQVMEGSEVDLEKVELAENLHCSGLTKLQRDRQIARYVRALRWGGYFGRAPRKKGAGPS
jgi:hypothetical protein